MSIFGMHRVIVHGSEKLRSCRGSCPATSMSACVTEPDAGLDTTRIKTFAKRTGEGYVINGGRARPRYAEGLLMRGLEGA
jgi:acyl-CoA dehydrogenase